MAAMRVTAEGTIAASAERVYGSIAAYREHHHRDLPPAFSDFRVEEGGVGAGTVIGFRLTFGGRTRTYRSALAEPQPARVVTEHGLVRGGRRIRRRSAVLRRRRRAA